MNQDNLNEELNNMDIDKSSKRHKCIYCLKEVNGSLRCSRCRTATYCNRECQRDHWSVHKNSCVDSNNEDITKRIDLKANNHYEQGN